MTIRRSPYLISHQGRPAPVVDGFTAQQRFSLSWSQTYREKVREAQLRRDVTSDPHSRDEFRVNGVVRNMDAWCQAFGVKSGDKLYLEPGDRVAIW